MKIQCFEGERGAGDVLQRNKGMRRLENAHARRGARVALSLAFAPQCVSSLVAPPASVWGLGLRASSMFWGLGFRASSMLWGLGFRASSMLWGLGLRDWDANLNSER